MPRRTISRRSPRWPSCEKRTGSDCRRYGALGDLRSGRIVYNAGDRSRCSRDISSRGSRPIPESSLRSLAHAPQDKIATTPIRAATPALLISGSLDPITPKEYAADVAKTLPNSLHVVVANVAHVAANPCVHGLVAAFMKAGSAKGLDTGCAARFPPLKFVTKIPTEG
jgi:pimeloyl-ACP methyl ester carboxylesterase